MIIKRIHYFIIIFLIIAIPLRAEKNITLQNAIDLSLANNNTYKIAMEKVKESSFKVRETWGMLWPDLSTDVAYTRQGADAGFSSSIAGQYDIKLVNGKLSVNPGVFYNSLQASRNGHIIAENEVRRIKADTIIQTIKLYYQILLTKEIIKLSTESLKALKENLKAVTIGYQKGTVSKLDYLRAKVAFSNEKTRLINAENDYLTAVAALNIHLGRDIHDSITIDDKAIDVNINELESAQIENKAIENMIGEALKNRPELLQIKFKKMAAAHSASAVESIYLWPTLFVSGNYGFSKAIPNEGGSSSSSLLLANDPQMLKMLSLLSTNIAPSGWNKSWAITFGATYRWGSLSPFDASNAKSKQLKSQEKQTEYQMEDFIKSVKLEVQRGYLKLKSASNSILSQQGNIQTAEESLKVSIIQFRSGIIDNTKLLDANVQLTTAKTLYIQALHDYQLAKAELNKAIGQDYFSIK